MHWCSIIISMQGGSSRLNTKLPNAGEKSATCRQNLTGPGLSNHQRGVVDRWRSAEAPSHSSGVCARTINNASRIAHHQVSFFAMRGLTVMPGCLYGLKKHPLKCCFVVSMLTMWTKKYLNSTETVNLGQSHSFVWEHIHILSVI